MNNTINAVTNVDLIGFNFQFSNPTCLLLRKLGFIVTNQSILAIPGGWSLQLYEDGFDVLDNRNRERASGYINRSGVAQLELYTYFKTEIVWNNQMTAGRVVATDCDNKVYYKSSVFSKSDILKMNDYVKQIKHSLQVHYPEYNDYCAYWNQF